MSVEELAVGDIVVVRPGDRVPSDGKIIDGLSEVDEAPVTGESVPVAKEAGDKVYAGSINTNGELRVEISHVAADNTIARIIHLVEEAQGSKAPMARLIDRFSAWYTPAAMVGRSAGHRRAAARVRRRVDDMDLSRPRDAADRVPVRAGDLDARGDRIRPCRRRPAGLLIKGGAALEMLGKVKTVAFDKTGTLTRGTSAGDRHRADCRRRGGRPGARGRGRTQYQPSSRHRHRRSRQGEVAGDSGELRRRHRHSGQGRDHAAQGGFASVGSPRYAAEQTALDDDVARKIVALEEEGKTVVVLLSGKRVDGLIALRDEPRADAAAGIARLNAAGIATVMLTGDNQRTADAIAATLGLEVRAELLPDAKLAEIGR